MRRTTWIAAAGVLALTAGAAGARGGAVRAVAYRRSAGDAMEVGLVVRGAPGRAFRWELSLDSPTGPWVPLGVHALRDGAGRVERRLPALLADREVYLRAVMHDGRGSVTTPASLGSYHEEPVGDLMDISWGLGGVALPSGTDVSSAQPWSEFVTIVGRNNDPSHPDALVLVDESRWAPPGPAGLPGPGRRAPRATGSAGGGSGTGKLLAVARDTRDANQDGLVDVPRPEPSGGEVIFLFSGPTRATSVTVYDVDEPGGTLRSYSGPTLLGEDSIPAGAPGGDQVLSVPAAFSLLTKLVVEFEGTGGIRNLSTIPCPAILSFDETTTGVPLDLVAGQELGGAYAAIGLFHGFVGATNNAPGGPDLALLYDTGDPAAADPDLATPGPGMGNDTPYRKVLVVAGDDTDADDDGVVDVPSASSAGGWLTLGWVTSDVYFQSATVIDVDLDETGFVRVWDLIGGFVDLPLTPLGNNSVQTIAATLGPTRQIELFTTGSAALAELRLCSD